MTMGKWNWIGEIWGFHSIHVEDSGFLGCYAVAAQHSKAADSFSWWKRLKKFILSPNDRNNQILISTDDRNGISFYFWLMTEMELVAAFNCWQKQQVSTFNWWKMDPVFHLMTETEPVFKVLCFYNHTESWQYSMYGQFNLNFSFNVLVLTLCSVGVVCQFFSKISNCHLWNGIDWRHI